MINLPCKLTVKNSFWVMALIIAWLHTSNLIEFGLWLIIIFYSILIHECGHAFTALAFGQKAEMELMIFGGITKRQGPELKTWQEILVVFNGSGAGLLLAALAWSISNMYTGDNTGSLIAYMAAATFTINLSWTFFTLLPIQPFDGGKLLELILRGIFGAKGTKLAFFVGTLVAGVLGIAIFPQSMFFGTIFILMAFENYKNWKLSLSFSDSDLDLKLKEMLHEAQEDYIHGNTQAAEEKLTYIRENSKKGIFYQLATQQLAMILAQQKDYQTAYELLKSIQGALKADGLVLLQELAYLKGLLKEAITVGQKAYQFSPTYQVALINAMSHALLSETNPAIGWLKRAINDGLPNVSQVLARKEFDGIRTEPMFKKMYN